MAEKEKKICNRCKKEKTLNGNFYKVSSPLFSDGYLATCNDCVKEIVDVENVDSIKNFLRQIDKPYIESTWEKAVNNNGYSLGNYLKYMNMGQYKNKSWNDSDSIVTESNKPDVGKDDKQEKIDNRESNLDDLVDKWGFGYTNEEYMAFEKKHFKLKRSYDEKTEMHSEALRTYIVYKVKAEIATAKGQSKEAKEWGALAQKAAQDARINPNQMSKSDISGGIDVMSQLFEAVESEVGVIPLLPRLLEQPYDDADMIIWSTINYIRKLEEKPRIRYRDIYNFYDEMINEHCEQQNMTPAQKEEFIQKRKNVFRDMESVYIEPLYDEVQSEDGTNDE